MLSVLRVEETDTNERNCISQFLLTGKNTWLNFKEKWFILAQFQRSTGSKWNMIVEEVEDSCLFHGSQEMES